MSQNSFLIVVSDLKIGNNNNHDIYYYYYY